MWTSAPATFIKWCYVFWFLTIDTIRLLMCWPNSCSFFPTCPKIKSLLKKMPSGNGRLSSHNVPPQYRTHSYYSSYLSQGIDTAACVPHSTCSEPKAAGQSRTHTHALRAINFYPEIINSVSKYIWGRFILWVKGAVKFIKINKFKGKTFMSIICSGDFRFKETRTMC